MRFLETRKFDLEFEMVVTVKYNKGTGSCSRCNDGIIEGDEILIKEEFQEVSYMHTRHFEKQI